MKILARKMMAVAILPAAAACGDDGGPVGPQPAEIAGIYELCSLSFDPEGDLLTTVDIRAEAMEIDNPQIDQPELRVNADGNFQLVYTPDGAFVEETIRGRFNITGQQLGLTLTSSGTTVDPTRLLLPATFNVTFQASPRSLSTTGTSVYNVAREDYAELAGVSESGLADEIPGRLAASFRANGCG